MHFAFCILHVLPGAGQSPHCSLLVLAWLSTPPIPINILCKGEVSSLIIIGDNISYKSFLRCHTHMQCIWFDLSHRCGRTSQRRTSKAPTQSTSFCWTIRIQSFCCDMLWHFSLSSRFQPCTSRWVRSCATTVSPSHGHLKIVRISYHLEMFLSYMWVGWLGRVFMWCEKICRTASWLMPIWLKSTSQSLSPFVIPPSSPWSPLRGDGRGGGFVGFPAPPIPPFWFGWVWLVSKGVPPLTLSISRV